MVGSAVARAVEAPGRGYHWGERGARPTCPAAPGSRWAWKARILHGLSDVPDGSLNLIGALRRAMATSGYSDLKEFQRVEVAVTPNATAPNAPPRR